MWQAVCFYWIFYQMWMSLSEHAHLVTISWNMCGDAGQQCKVVGQTPTTQCLLSGAKGDIRCALPPVGEQLWTTTLCQMQPGVKLKHFLTEKPRVSSLFSVRMKKKTPIQLWWNSSSCSSHAPLFSCSSYTMCSLGGGLDSDYSRKLLQDSLQLN